MIVGLANAVRVSNYLSSYLEAKANFHQSEYFLTCSRMLVTFFNAVD